MPPLSAREAPVDGTPGPSWSAQTSFGEAFTRGLAIAGETPAFILGATGAGFGALAHDAKLPFGPTALMSLVLYATPAQVVLVDQLARGSSLLGVAIAVSFTAVRLLPMTVSLMPLLRSPGAPRWTYIAAAHFIAVTGWSEAFRRLPPAPPHLRMPHFLGLGFALMLVLTMGTVLGYWLAGFTPPLLLAALLFMTPLYFAMSSILNAKQSIDAVSLLSGIAIGPILYLSVPGLDLLLTGLIGGTFAFLVAHPTGKARRS